MDLKEANNFIYLLGESPPEQKSVPDVPVSAPQVYRALHQAIKNGLVKSAHDLSEGGLAVTAAEMCIGGRLGLNIAETSIVLFAEANGCLLVEVSPTDAPAFEKQLANLPFNKVGEVTTEPILKFSEVEIPIEELIRAFNSPSHL